MARRIVILSDTHLGKPGRGARSAEALRPLWQGAAELIVNGDLAEVHDNEYRGAAARQVVKLQDMCEDDGVRVCLLSGNHDPLITDRRYLRLCGGEVFLTHGDVLHPAISPWTQHAKRLRQLHDDMLASLDPAERETADGALWAAQYASHMIWDEFADQHSERRTGLRKAMALGRKASIAMWYWATIAKRAAAFAQKYAPECRFFVFGHIHRAGVWRHGSHTIINTGSYDFPSKPRAVVIDDRELSIRRIRRVDGCWRFAPRPVSRWVLRNAQTLPPEEQSIRMAG